MKTNDALTSALILISLAAFPGCTDSRQEQAAKDNERKRIEAEEQAQRDVKKANSAITEMGKKIGRPARTPDLNLPEKKKATEPAPPPAKP
jgi:hypothetical protein